jgi:membrane fusion protein (multidrug efflux system)
MSDKLNSTEQPPNSQPAEAPRVIVTAPPPGDSNAVQASKRRSWVRRARWPSAFLLLAALGYFLKPMIVRAFTTVSTDDAYVNGHVTLVAPRVPGKVIEVFVDNNNRVKIGDLLVRIDPEPYQVQVNLKKASVEQAEADLGSAISQARGLEALARCEPRRRRWSALGPSTNVANGS